MDSNNNTVLPVEEESRIGETADIFDFKNIRNCLPVVSPKSERISDYIQNIGVQANRLIKIKALMNQRKKFSELSPKIVALLEKRFSYQGLACLVDASSCQKTEKNLERLQEEVMERKTLPHTLVKEFKEENDNISPVYIYKRRIRNSETRQFLKQKRAESHRKVSVLRENDRLRRACYSRGLSLENEFKRVSHPDTENLLHTTLFNDVPKQKEMDQAVGIKMIKSRNKKSSSISLENEPERVSHPGTENPLPTALLNDILKQKEKIQKELDETVRLIKILKERERRLSML